MTFLTMGDLGDCLYLAPSMKLVEKMSGKPVILYCKDGLRENDPFVPKIHLIKGLLESQDYVEAVLVWNGEHIDFDASRFRDHGHPFGVTLAQLQAEAVGLTPEFSTPWLSVDPMPHTKHAIVVARSFRYRNFRFPWAQLVKAFRERIFFIGLSHEFVDFCANFGDVRYLHTADLHEAARAIAGSALFIGNQSAPYAVCEGLRHNSIQETCLEVPDCIYPRDNAAFCFDGGISISAFGQTLEMPAAEIKSKAHLNETPPNGWRVKIGEHSAQSYSFTVVFEEIKQKLRQSGLPVPEDLREMIIDQSSADLPPPPPFVPIKRLRELVSR